MAPYYDRLSAERLRRCYELAPSEVQAYLQAEIDHLAAHVAPGTRGLEIGCGYGRVLAPLARLGGWLAGIDLSLSSLALARREPRAEPHPALACMDAAALAFRPASFDLVCCPQNGISACGVAPRRLLEAAVELLVTGGKALFFSYADAFWPHRLAWFRIQAAHGLVGEIDEAATGGGVIVCGDGFRATTLDPDRFRELARGLAADVSVQVLAEASVVCTLTRKEEP